MSCELGRLYNKDAIIEFLLDRAKQPEETQMRLKHIRGLKGEFKVCKFRKINQFLKTVIFTDIFILDLLIKIFIFDQNLGFCPEFWIFD